MSLFRKHVAMAINSTPHIHHLVICANMFVRDGDKRLLLKRSDQKKHLPGYIHPIGGKVDRDEDPCVAAQRELLEEAGITVSNIRLEAVITELKPGEQENRLIFHFSGEYNGEEITPCDEGKFVRLTTEELLATKLFPSVAGVIQEIVDPAKGTIFASYTYDDTGNAQQISYLRCQR
ncbi:MAG: NUDIX domain-containing protein [bacterium]|nr:NUDIX domain-containing protein [bacterium]